MRLNLYLFGKLILTSFTFKPSACILYVMYPYLIPHSKDMRIPVYNSHQVGISEVLGASSLKKKKEKFLFSELWGEKSKK